MRVVHVRDKVKGALYIGRPSKWGNPYKIGEHGTREEVIEKYGKHVFTHADLYYSLPELRQYEALECYCSPLPCHGDVLARLQETHVDDRGRCCELRIAITGSREGVSYEEVATIMDPWRGRGNTWVLGGALGVDHHALRFCQEHEEEYWVFHPAGKITDAPAGPGGENRKLLAAADEVGKLELLGYDLKDYKSYHRRNGIMLDYGGGVDLCLAFPSPKEYGDFLALYEAGKLDNLKDPIRGHGGTVNCISQAKMRGIPVKVTGRR